MDDRTHKALLESIAFWRKCAAGEAISHGVDTCALCKEFYEDACVGCPIREHTGKWCCDDTPYDEYLDVVYDDESYTRDPMYGPLRAAAQAELDFLISLLPEEGTQD